MTRFLVACLLLAAAGTAAAATPRVQALGGDGAYLEDAGNVLVWSGSLADHANRLTVASGVFDGRGYPRSHGAASGPWCGAQIGMGGRERPVAAAFYAMSRAADQGGGDLVDLQAGAYQALVCLNDWENGSFTLGWRQSGAADQSLGEQRQVLGFGLRSPLDDTSYMDVGFDVIGVRPRDAVADTLPEDERAFTDYAARVRIVAGLSRTLVLTLVGTAEGIGPAFGESAGLPTSHYRAGAALTWLPDPDRMVVVSADYHDFGVPHDWSSRALLLRCALEARLNAFLSVRAAAAWEEREAPDGSLAPLNLGLGIHVLEWDLDLAAGTDPPLDVAGRRLADGGPRWGWLSAALSCSF